MQKLYAPALGASDAKGVESGMSDLGFVVKPVLVIDAKATEHILHRQRIGKMKLIFMAPFRPDTQFPIQQLSTQVLNPHDREQARSETVDTISQRHATRLSSS